MLTQNYEKFTLKEENRDLKRTHINKLKDSLQERGFIAARPVLVNENYEILDGQHRFMACKELNIPFEYVVQKNASPEMILNLNTTQRSWGAGDYVKFYANQVGNQAYKNLYSFMQEYKLSASVALSLMGRQTSGSLSDTIRNGQLIITKREVMEAKERYTWVSEILKINRLPVGGRVLTAIVKLSDCSGFQWETLLKKVSRQSDKVTRCATINGYIQMFGEIYNNRNANPINFSNVLSN